MEKRLVMTAQTIKLGFAVAVFALASLGLFVSTASADSLSVDFENPPYVLGSINGQDGWGPAVNPAYDQEVDSSFGTPGFGAQSFRMSNAVTSGSFGDWVFSKSLGDEAGETDAENDGMSGGARQPHYEAQFEIASAVPGAEQPGLQISMAPDRGDGARMSYLRFEDATDGIHVIFFDYQDIAPFGTSVGDAANGCGVGDNFFGTDVGTMDRTIPHTVKFSMDFVDGPRNDVVEIYIDGVLVHTGTSWEDYFRYCEGNPTRTVDSLIFQARGNGGSDNNPVADEEGFLIDNLTLLSGDVPVPPPPPSGDGAINSSFIKIEVSGSGTIRNITSSKASTGGNDAEGSYGGRGGRGGDVEAEAEDGGDANGNNGGAMAGDGGAGGDASIGGDVRSGRATSVAVTDNGLNDTDIGIDVGNLINSTLIKVEVDNDACECNLIDNKTRSRARTGGNDAEGSYGGDGGSGGEVEAEADGGDANGNNGGAQAGTGGHGGSGDISGEVLSGVADSFASTTNRANISRIRIN